MIKKFLVAFAAFAVMSFAEDDFVPSNVCDTLPNGKLPQIQLKLAYLDEINLTANTDLSNGSAPAVIRHNTLDDLKPIAAGSGNSNGYPEQIPVSLKAECRSLGFMPYVYGTWNKNQGRWELSSEENLDFYTFIMDSRQYKTSEYDSSNSYNLLAVSKDNLDEKTSFSAGEMLVSKSYEFAFEWWSAIVKFSRDSVVTKTEGDSIISLTYTKSQFSSSVGNDSLNVLRSARNALVVPSDVQKISIQMFHGVLMDSRKINPEENYSSSSVSPEESSDSMGPDAIETYFNDSARRFVDGQIRRLDGTVVNSREPLTPGVYYIRGADGLWKKKLVLTK